MWIHFGGKKYLFHSDASSIAQLKRELAATGLDIRSLRLFWSGEELKDDRECEELKMEGREVELRLVVSEVDETTSSPSSPSSSAISITELRPNRGFTAGGQQVKILGKHFPEGQGTFICKFGNTIVTAIALSETELKCISPPHSPGTVAVEVSADGINFTNDQVIFTYLDPTSCVSMTSVPVTTPTQIPDTCRVSTVLPNQHLGL